jgi:hypothetical protein
MYTIHYKRSDVGEEQVINGPDGKEKEFTSVETAELHCQTSGLVRQSLDYLLIVSTDYQLKRDEGAGGGRKKGKAQGSAEEQKEQNAA